MKALSTVKPAIGFFRGNRTRLITELKKATNCPENSIIVLKAATETLIYDDDQHYDFVQDGNFWWTTGVDQPECYSIIEISTGAAHIFIPDHPKMKRWWEKVWEIEDYMRDFEIDSANLLPKMESFIDELKPQTIFVTGDGINCYSGVGPRCAEFDWFSKFNVNYGALYPTINEIRVRKVEEEVRLMKESCRISSEAHQFVMRNIKPGMNEVHAQSLFRFSSQFWSYEAYPAYEEICATGNNGTVLHYHKNNTDMKDGDMFLIDAGTRYNRYCSDITCTYPVNGKFTQKQKQIYDIVLKANRDVIAAIKPGVHWQDLHHISEKIIIQGLVDLGIVRGEVEELWKKRASYVFYPHGLGHYIGIYVHDLKGDPRLENDKKPIKRQALRVTRRLEAGMCLTVEPGLYFIEGLLNQAKESLELKDCIDWDKLAEFRKEIQAVRIEDDIHVTETGAEVLTHLPRTTEEIEKCMAGEEWQ